MIKEVSLGVLVFSITILFSNCGALANKKLNNTKAPKIVIDSMYVYQGSSTRGYTTAGASTHYRDMDSLGVARIRLDSLDVLQIEDVLNHSKKRRHFQTKFGVQHIFTLYKRKNDVFFRKLHFGSGPDYYVLSDLTQFIDYAVTDKNQVTWLNSFRERMKAK